MLYAKCCKIVKKELKKKEYLRKNEIEQLIKDVQVGQFYSKNKMGRDESERVYQSVS